MNKEIAVSASMNQSIKILREATPIIQQLLGFREGEIIDVENQNNDACRHLDLLCGIDYIVYFKDMSLSNGLAWRAQEEDRLLGPYNSFTIRKERESGAMTEYEKRKLSIERNALYPYYTAQAFYSCHTKELKTLAIARTKDIIDCISKGLYTDRTTGKNEIGQAKFYAVWWKVMKNNGYKILDWYK